MSDKINRCLEIGSVILSMMYAAICISAYISPEGLKEPGYYAHWGITYWLFAEVSRLKRIHEQEGKT